MIVEEDGIVGVVDLRGAVPAVGSGRRVAAARTGCERGDRIVLMLGNQVELWEIVLAAIKLGAVIIPASTLLTPDDLADRVRRGGARFVVARDVDADVVPAGARHVPPDRRRPSRSRAGSSTTTPMNFPAEGFVPDGVSPGRRPAAAVLHLRHHRAAQTG